jgi:hypothetical protein
MSKSMPDVAGAPVPSTTNHPAKRRKSRPQSFLTIILSTVLALAAGGGIAFAYWTSTGTGTGTASTGVSEAFDITSNVPEGYLAPGSAGQTVGFTVTNPTAAVLSLTAVTVRIALATGADWVPTGDCSAADYSVSITTPPTAGEIGPDGLVTGTATVILANTAVNQDDCQGQDVPLLFSADAPA